MPSIIDSLIVELSLDSTKFEKGQKDAVNSLRQLENAAQKHVKGTTTETDKLVQSFTALQGRLLAVGALLAAGLGFESFTARVSRLNAETGFLAQSLGVSTQELQKWEAAGATVGAQANEIASSFATIKNSMADLQLGKGSFLSEFSRTTHMRGQGPAVELYDSKGQARNSSDILVDISKWYAAQPNKAVASRLMSQIGFGQGMVNMLGLGPEELQKRLKRAEQFAPSDEQIKKFQELVKTFGELSEVTTALANSIAARLAPVLTGVLKMLTEWLGGVAGKGQNPAEAAGSGLGKMGYPELTPDGKKPSLMSRGWNYLFGGKSGAPEGGGSAAPSAPGAVGGGTSGGGATNGSLAQQRQSFYQELQDKPGLRDKIMRIAANEQGKNPQGVQAVMESMMNRAIVRGTNLETQARWFRSEAGGYYEMGNMGRGSLENPAHKAILEKALSNTFAGSNISNYATDNSSGGLAARERASGSFQYRSGYGGESFFAPGTKEPKFAQRWAKWQQQMVAQESGNHSLLSRALPSADSPSITPAGRSFENWRNLGLGSRGALMRGGDSTTNNNSNSSSTNINSMHVSVPPGSDPEAYAAGIRQELQHFDNVQNSNTGLQ